MSHPDLVHLRAARSESLELNTRFYPRQHIEQAAREFSAAAAIAVTDAGPERVRLTFQGPADVSRAFANRVLAIVREAP
jgi:hypothetical protein